MEKIIGLFLPQMPKGKGPWWSEQASLQAVEFTIDPWLQSDRSDGILVKPPVPDGIARTRAGRGAESL